MCGRGFRPEATPPRMTAQSSCSQEQVDAEKAEDMNAAVLLGCFLSALSLTETSLDFRPAATLSPAEAFSPNTTPAPPTTTTTTPAPTNNTTPAPPTTTTTTPAPPTNTTTPAPTNTTTTPAPTNTTTPPPPTTTTTPAPPTTTTTPAHPPTVSPPSNVTVGNYTLLEGKAVCLMAVMALQFRLQTPEAAGRFVVQPQKTQTRGGCEDSSANLTLVFPEGFITFLYNKSVQDDRVYVHTLSFNLSYAFVQGGTKVHAGQNKTTRLFSARVGRSYSCRGEALLMGHGLFLDITQDRMQAFNLTRANEFGPPDPCAADQPVYGVVVGVAVTLLLLLAVALLVYLLGRRRRTDGYQSL